MEKARIYTLIRDIEAPYVVDTGNNRRGPNIRKKKFKKGQMIKGVMKYANGRPAYILVGGAIPVEARHLKILMAKDVEVSDFSGEAKAKSDVPGIIHNNANPKVKYIDAMIVGGIVGALAVHFAEKKGFIQNPDQKNKIYGAVGGALLLMYVVYRYQSAKKKPENTQK